MLLVDLLNNQISFMSYFKLIVNVPFGTNLSRQKEGHSDKCPNVLAPNQETKDINYQILSKRPYAQNSSE